MKKIFTSPPDIVLPSSDNIDGNLVVAKGDYIIKSENIKYMAIELLGVGTFGQVFRCVSNEGDEVAIKVVKSFNKFYQYEMNGLRILKKVRDSGFTEHFGKFYDAFVYKHHLCVVLEILKENMYQVAQILKFRGFSIATVRRILQQLLSGVGQLQSIGVTHCDLKPENILVSNYFTEHIKIVDFGSSSTRPMSTVYYVQSRYYRAPEVILGIPYNSVIDIWSIGCIAYEILMGMPLFPGSSNHDQIHRIHEFLPNGLPSFMMEFGANTSEYFHRQPGGAYSRRDNPEKITYHDVVNNIRSKCGVTEEIDLFIDLLFMFLEPSYLERRNAYDLLKHPFFLFEESVTNYDFNRESVLTKENSINSIERQRKTSLYDVGSIDDINMRHMCRKGSLYDPSHDNRKMG